MLHLFALTPGDFFQPPGVIDDTNSRFSFLYEFQDPTWRANDLGMHRLFQAPGLRPRQGWKVHVSATPSNSEEVAKLIQRYCQQNGLSFKVARSRHACYLINSKLWPRASSGKFSTIYFDDQAALSTHVMALDALLSPYPGPYVLSDKRYKRGPVHLRYGLYTPEINSDGSFSNILFDDQGNSYPDRRQPFFTPPPFVEVPDFLLYEDPDNGENLPYEVLSALAHSNAGGVYLAKKNEPEEIVRLREARPYAGLDSAERDAVQRLFNEREVLKHLSGSIHFPEFRGLHNVWEHWFLATNYVQGVSLLSLTIRNNPLVTVGPKHEQLDEYIVWGSSVAKQLKAVVSEAHERDVVLNDIHPANFIVSDEKITFVDLEAAFHASQSTPTAHFGVPGFHDFRSSLSKGSDIRSLDMTILSIFMPKVQLIGLDADKSQALALHALDSFERMGATSLDELANTLGIQTKKAKTQTNRTAFRATALARRRLEISDAILERADFSNPEYAFSCDPQGLLARDGASFAYGASGVLYALASSDCEKMHLERVVNWLEHYFESNWARLGSGFFLGKAGIAWSIYRSGFLSSARNFLDRWLREYTISENDLSFRSGCSGDLFALSDIYSEKKDLVDRRLIDDLAQLVVSKLKHLREFKTDYGIDLESGTTGVALSLLRYYEATNNTMYLKFAEELLVDSVAELSNRGSDGLYVRKGSQNLPYFLSGSGGIALVLKDYLRFRESQSFRTAISRIAKASAVPFCFSLGYFEGRSGLIELNDEGDFSSDMGKWYLEEIELHSARSNGLIAFPGRDFIKLSDDFSTGTAGVLFSLRPSSKRKPQKFLC
jgi:serine/threonine protein kinase